MEFSFGVVIQSGISFFGTWECCGRNKTTKNRSVSGASPPSGCLTVKFQNYLLVFFFIIIIIIVTFSDWSLLELRKTGQCQNCIRGSLWTLVKMCWPVLTPCKDFWKQLPTSLADIWQGEENIASKKKWEQTENTERRRRKEPGLGWTMFPLYESQELSLSNCYF